MEFPPEMMEELSRAMVARRVRKIPPQPNDLVVACFHDKAEARIAMDAAAGRGIHGFIFAMPRCALLFASADANVVALACDRIIDLIEESVEAESAAAR